MHKFRFKKRNPSTLQNQKETNVAAVVASTMNDTYSGPGEGVVRTTAGVTFVSTPFAPSLKNAGLSGACSSIVRSDMDVATMSSAVDFVGISSWLRAASAIASSEKLLVLSNGGPTPLDSSIDMRSDPSSTTVLSIAA